MPRHSIVGGNPIYDWEAHAAEGYRWWTDRLAASVALTDVVRIDHFRALNDYWEVPAGAATAELGRWLPGPGASFLSAVEQRLPSMPFIAEDLGELHPGVSELRDRFGLPGMKVLVFGFESDAHDPFLPHNLPRRCVAYTGTHDNDPVQGWWDHASDEVRRFSLDYFDGWDGTDVPGRMIRALWASDANWVVIQMQDLLRLGRQSRTNTPAVADGNGRWRMTTGQLDDQRLQELTNLNQEHARQFDDG